MDNLQNELKSAPNKAKAELVESISEVKAQISEAKDLLQECTDKPNRLPSQVTGLSARPVSVNQIDLSWNPSPSDEGITHYNVYRGTSPGFPGNTATLIAQPTTNSYSDTNLDPATKYYYKVTAVNREGIGPLSDEVSATTPKFRKILEILMSHPLIMTRGTRLNGTV